MKIYDINNNRRRPGITRNKNRHYFTEVHQEAIKKYVQSTDPSEKNRLYIQLIRPVFDHMVDNIVYTFGFANLPDIEVLREECKIWLVTILEKFDVTRGKKAFSYFSVVAKNWFIHEAKQHSLHVKRQTSLEDISAKDTSILASKTDIAQEREDYEFWTSFYGEMDLWGEEKMRDNERQVYEAVKYIFQNSDKIEIFNKKAIYLYLREITGLNVKQVVTSLKRLRKRYRHWRGDWEAGNITNI